MQSLLRLLYFWLWCLINLQDYALTADNYAYDVVSGQIPAGKYIQLAAQAHLEDKKKEDSLFYFSDAKAARACKFIEAQYHTKGKWARKKSNLILDPWQIFFCLQCVWMVA